jgi:hypothetical protein
MQERREWTIGLNTLHFEPPDLLWVEFRGPTLLEDATRLVVVYGELGRSRPYFMVADMKEAGAPDAESMRYLSENARPEWVLGIVYIGARLVQKAAARGIFLAAQLTGNWEAGELAKIHFVSTPAEAYALVARLRAGHGPLGSQAGAPEPLDE